MMRQKNMTTTDVHVQSWAPFCTAETLTTTLTCCSYYYKYGGRSSQIQPVYELLNYWWIKDIPRNRNGWKGSTSRRANGGLDTSWKFDQPNRLNVMALMGYVIGIARSMTAVINDGSDRCGGWPTVDGWGVECERKEKRHAVCHHRENNNRDPAFIGAHADDDAMIVEEANSCERGGAKRKSRLYYFIMTVTHLNSSSWQTDPRE